MQLSYIKKWKPTHQQTSDNRRPTERRSLERGFFAQRLYGVSPEVGRKEDFNNRTEAYIMYDDTGIYFGGTNYESNLSNR